MLSDRPWQTAPRKAAGDGNLKLARTLPCRGADPGIRDERFDSTPLGWARYFGRQGLTGMPEPITELRRSARRPAAARRRT